MKVLAKFLPFFSLIISTTLYAGPTIVVNGQNNIALDRAAIQTAIDQSQPSTVIVLQGTFLLDGTSIDIYKSNLSITGSGSANGHTTTLIGLTNTSGVPRGDIGAPSPHHFNRAFEVSHDAQNIRIEGIKFVNLNRGIQISPQLTTQTDLCTDIVIGKGGSNYTIVDNLFVNNLRPFNVTAEADNVRFIKNKMVGSRTRDMSVGGLGSLACLVPTSSGGLTTQLLENVGIPKNFTASTNIIEGSLAQFTIALLEVENAVLDNNNITTGNNVVGVITYRVDKGVISNNVIDMNGAGFFGIAIDPASPPVVFNNPKVQVFGNLVKNSIPDVGTGIVVDSAKGMYAYDNHFSSIGGVDYLICDANADTNLISSTICDGLGIVSSNNTILVNDPSVTVMDLGVDNKVVFDSKK